MEGTSRKCEVRLGQRGGSSYGKGGRGMRSLGSSIFSNPRTSLDWFQLEPHIFIKTLIVYIVISCIQYTYLIYRLDDLD